MKSLETKTNIKFLSTDLTGFEDLMLLRGYNPYYVSLLKRGPSILFELLGSVASLELLSSANFRTNYEKLLEGRYAPGTLSRNSCAIQHYHDYLVVSGTIKQKADGMRQNNIVRKVSHFYFKNRTPYYHDIENAYSDYLNIEKEYCADEKRKRLGSYRKFVSFLIKSKISTFDIITGCKIVEFSRLEKTLKTDWNYLKYFLKFAYRQGYILEDLSSAFLSRKRLRIRKKRFLGDEKIDAIVASIGRETSTEKRNFSMINLMARLGLRPSETIRIKLKHIDWVNSKIFIRGKNKTEDWLPLTDESARHLIDYLKNSSVVRHDPEYLFLSERAPFKPLKTHAHLSKVLSDAYEEAGIKPPSGDVRLNVFRHSIATSIVNRDGQNFFTAQALLRHANPEMTMHYAKYHSKRQPIFELDWPETVS